MTIYSRKCEHLQSIQLIEPGERVCQQCVERGDTWVHLRVCQTCGEVNCCDSSKNKHATKHYHRSGHPVVASAEIGEAWVYCYRDDVFLPTEAL